MHKQKQKQIPKYKGQNDGGQRKGGKGKLGEGEWEVQASSYGRNKS